MEFLRQIANTLYKNNGYQLSDCCIVFPNQRAGLFFTKYLSEIIEKPIWSPEVITINTLTEKLSKLQVADDLKLVFDLYESYKTELKTTETFDDFYYWGEMLLADFDDIDKYLVPVDDLFKNLASLKEIEDVFSGFSDEQKEAIKAFWSSFNPDKYSKHQGDFISIWSALLAIYKNFNAKLKAQNLAYEGLVYRYVATNLENITSQLDHKKYIFIGFNALNECEKKLFYFLKNKGLAEFYWDYDNYYVENNNHEAGFFLRTNLKDFVPSQLDLSFDNLADTSKKIDLIAVPSNVGQAKIIHSILSEIKDEDLSKTAVILADEHLLMPVLYSLPKSIDKVNITMGYPLKDTPIYSFIEHIVELHKTVKKEPNYIFYYQQVIYLLSNQFVRLVDEEAANNLRTEIITGNKIYLEPLELAATPFLTKLFSVVKNPDDISAYLLSLLEIIVGKCNQESNKQQDMLELEYIYHTYLSIKRLKELIVSYSIAISKVDTYFKLLKKVIASQTIPFIGEPLAGLQLMGILETRALDFEKLIILSLNEGVFPKNTSAPSFVPYNLRKGFGLPTIEHQDAIFSYYFYRLIQRAKQITFLYNTQSNNTTSGEVSRFIYQLKYESGYTISEKSQVFDVAFADKKPIVIDKTEQVQTKLSNYLSNSELKRYFSASALNSYIDCSLKFYFRYIANIQETNKILEEIDAATYGNLLHKVMKFLYQPYLQKIITADDLKALKSNHNQIEKFIVTAFHEDYFKQPESKNIALVGNNILIAETLKKYIDRILTVDQQYAPFTVVALEEKYTLNLPVNLAGKEQEICLAGNIDRIDKVGNNLRIVDYKSGNVDLDFKGFDSLFDSINEKRNKAAFQILFYSMLYHQSVSSANTIVPAIYQIKSMFDDNFSFNISADKSVILDYSLVHDDYQTRLKELLAEIFNSATNFVQTENTKNCVYCPYSGICKRD